MRVCFVDRIGAHAIWGVLNPVATILIADGHDVDFVRMDDGGDRGRYPIPEKVEVFDLPVPVKRGPLSLIYQHLVFALEFRKLLRRLKPDIVHTNFAVPSIVARWMAAREGVPVIVSTQHELYGSMHPHYRWGLRLTERYCAAVVYVSYTVANSFCRAVIPVSEISPESTQSHVVIPNGVDIAMIREANFDVNKRVPGQIVCAGRMVSLKGQQLLIEALPEVVQRHPHICLRLIGSGPMEEKLRHRVDELGLTKNVIFLGWRPHDEVLREMAMAELIIVPSRQEGFGLVVAEALVCGTPLLVSDIPVFREVLAGFDDQYRFFASNDVGSLREALLGFPFVKAAEQISGAAIPLADLEHLSAEVMAESYMQLYRRIAQPSDEA